MNKTLMLIICDFLLLSMLALARFDQPEELPESTFDANASSAAAEVELIRLLEETLESEQKSRSALNKDLDLTKQNLADQAQKLAEHEAALAGTQKTLEEKETEVAKLTETKRNIETERLELAQKFEAARIKLEEVNSQQIELVQTLGQFKEQSSVSKERLNQAEKDLLAREATLVEQENKLKAVLAQAQKLQLESANLQQQLHVAHAERTLLQQTLLQEQQEKQQLQAEKARVLAHADRLTKHNTLLNTPLP